MKVDYIDHMGSDTSVVNSARVSFAKTAENYTDMQNEQLIQYLATGLSKTERDNMKYELINVDDGNQAEYMINRIINTPTHWTPFAHTCISLRVTAPIPVRTQAFKHKQGLVENEESRRYISTEPELFVPTFRNKAENIKQGSKGIHPDDEYLTDLYIKQCDASIDLYNEFIAKGVAPEQARFILPQGVEVQWIWTGNLYAFANFYNKRSDSHAQKEIQDLAEMVREIIEPLFPISWKALTGK